MSTELTPLLKAGVTILALRSLQDLDLPAPTVGEVVGALGVTRSRAYELASAIEALLPNLHRPVGRPPIDDTTTVPSDTALPIVCMVRDFLMEHPGAATSGARGFHSVAFHLFVLDLLGPSGPAHGMPVPDVAMLVGVPEGTLRQWLRAPRPVPASLPTPSSSPLGGGVAEQVIALWERWVGPPTVFRDVLREHHRIDLSWHLLRSLLELSGHRQPQKRRKGDAEAIRGALERFFPGAQIMADGKHLVVELDGISYALNWELVVDADTGAHLGFDVSATEDSQALIDAVDMAVETIGDSPLAALADNKPSNHSDEVKQVMDESDIILMPSTPFRPENKSTVEGAFGLFAQTMPDIILHSRSPRRLVSRVMFYVLWAYCAGRNQAPQQARNGKSAADLFEEAEVSAEDRQAAKNRLLEIKKRILMRRDADRRREDPVVRTMMAREFEDLSLSDPEGRFVAALARLGLGPALEAVAVFKAKMNAGRLRTDFPQRYLLGIAHNVAEREEDLAVFHELLRLRTEAHDLLLSPMLDDLNELVSLPTTEFIGAVFERLRLATAFVDRRFWMARLIDAFASLKATLRQVHGPWLAKRVACLFGLPRTERDSLIAALATATLA